MTIQYADREDFYNGIHSLVVRGMTFEANYGTMIITLTGGY